VKRAGELLASFFDQQTFGAAREYSALFSSWRSVAGDALAAHSRIRELEHSVLLVEADHPGWIQILQTREKDLLDALRRRFPDRHITGISFRLSREPPPIRPSPEAQAGSAGEAVAKPPAPVAEDRYK
jgi:predicted nucleic acid-binding Zn ribbon protein